MTAQFYQHCSSQSEARASNKLGLLFATLDIFQQKNDLFLRFIYFHSIFFKGKLQQIL